MATPIDSRPGRRPAVFIGTMGTEAATITSALDLLLADGHSITDVVAVHTSPHALGPNGRRRTVNEAGPSPAVTTLRGQFPDGKAYDRAGRRDLGDVAIASLRCVPVERDGLAVDDVRSYEDGLAVFTTMHQEVMAAKRRGAKVHMSIAGGRKCMAVYGMAVAQLLFDSRDRLWHVIPSPVLEDHARLHPSPEQASIVRVPVLPLSLTYVGAVSGLLGDDDPPAALDRHERRLDAKREVQCRSFLEEKLTREERRLVLLLLREVIWRQNSPEAKDLARSLGTIAEGSVRKRMSEIYSKMRAHFELHDESADRDVLVGLYAPYFELLVT